MTALQHRPVGGSGRASRLARRPFFGLRRFSRVRLHATGSALGTGSPARGRGAGGRSSEGEGQPGSSCAGLERVADTLMELFARSVSMLMFLILFYLIGTLAVWWNTAG